MTTAPLEPVYLVMVIVPPFVVKVNWACTAAGSASTSSSGSNFTAQAVLKRAALVFGPVGQVVLAVQVWFFMMPVVQCPALMCGGGANNRDRITLDVRRNSENDRMDG